MILIIILFIFVEIKVYRKTSAFFELKRKSILNRYSLTECQARFRVSNGEAVYAESEKDKIFVMLFGMNQKVRIKNLFSGKYAVCDKSLFFNSFNSLIENGYKFYDSESYSELLKKGFRVSYGRI